MNRTEKDHPSPGANSLCGQPEGVAELADLLLMARTPESGTRSSGCQPDAPRPRLKRGPVWRRPLAVRDALNKAMDEELARDEKVYLMGEARFSLRAPRSALLAPRFCFSLPAPRSRFPPVSPPPPAPLPCMRLVTPPRTALHRPAPSHAVPRRPAPLPCMRLVTPSRTAPHRPAPSHAVPCRAGGGRVPGRVQDHQGAACEVRVDARARHAHHGDRLHGRAHAHALSRTFSGTPGAACARTPRSPIRFPKAFEVSVFRLSGYRVFVLSEPRGSLA